MKPQIRWVLFLFTILNSGFFFGQLIQQEKILKADSLVSSYSRSHAPGMAVGIIQEGKIIYKKTYGLANLEDRIPVTDSTAFDIASVSKQFTALVTLMAEKEGKLSLEDDIRTYLPELKHLPYKITLRQLANHTHGLPDFTTIKRLQGFGDEFRVTNTDAVKTVLAIKRTNFKPGDQYRYNNTGYMLLAEILRRVYKKDFAELLKAYIFDPLRMNHSMAVDDPVKIIPNRAESYQEAHSGFIKTPLGQMENGSSNIFMPLNDLCIWAANFQKPLVGSREMYDKMQQNTLLNNGEQIGYGLGLQTGKYKGLDIVFHGGGTASYRSYILHIPAYNLSVVLAGNKSTFDGLLVAYGLVDVLLKDHQILPASPKKLAYTAAELQSFEGTYEINPGNYLDIKTDGRNLYWDNNKTPLKAAGDYKFDISFLPTGSFTFHPGNLTYRIGDFTFICKKVILKPLKEDKVDLNKYVGFYRNEEFNTIYQLVIENDKLVARHAINPDIPLCFLSESEMYSYKSIFGRLGFTYGNNKSISGFVLSGANFTQIEFKKIK
ncbi:CubicO group peptidase (beta-lactamase class C family) [Chryseobacterium vietnamense]|uniref:CubicO group peptidase (Beta-lactamase class C family) n=1 Tax=Chryseobacterium vietnamense TaxID=866785 RepID=A0ACC6J3M1_9FLAO|nr:serine hydrolase domain-containing protein [Chryseobacterium vietnamense]MDR6457556.1 CubicO group peptidase (beta-lactamase class C family) [Chryseobacterium vietnamense]